MLKIIVYESNWYNSQVREFDNIFDALWCAKILRAENIEDRKVEIYCDPLQVYDICSNLRRTDAVAAGTYVAYEDLEPEEAPEEGYATPDEY